MFALLQNDHVGLTLLRGAASVCRSVRPFDQLDVCAPRAGSVQ